LGGYLMLRAAQVCVIALAVLAVEAADAYGQ
jgi:hypothetical protein